MAEDILPGGAHQMSISPEIFEQIPEMRRWLMEHHGDAFKVAQRHLQTNELFNQLGSMIFFNVRVGNVAAAQAMGQHLVALGYMLAKHDQENGIDATEDDLPDHARETIEAMRAQLAVQEEHLRKAKQSRNVDVV